MATQADAGRENHRRAVRFFWALLIGATLVSLAGNITHALLPYVSRLVVQIGAAAVPPLALLAAVHGIGLAVRAGASGRVYTCAVGAVGGIGLGAFVVSFLALRDLTESIGYSATTAWVFPTIVDTAVAVSTLMLVALGDKPTGRSRTNTVHAAAQTTRVDLQSRLKARSAKGKFTSCEPAGAGISAAALVKHKAVQATQSFNLNENPHSGASAAPSDTDLALELIASGATTQPTVTVIAVLSAHRGGASINAAAKASGINYRTAQRIVQAADQCRQTQFATVG